MQNDEGSLRWGLPFPFLSHAGTAPSKMGFLSVLSLLQVPAVTVCPAEMAPSYGFQSGVLVEFACGRRDSVPSAGAMKAAAAGFL